jgi:8-oxo-dGTP pyrophosphatase MutT (NUDIX family)
MTKEFYFAQKAVIESDGKVLLVQKSLDDPNQPGKWEVPGGRLDFGEDVDEHLKREVKEEVGLDVVPGRPFYVWQWQLKREKEGVGLIHMQIVAVARKCSLVGGRPDLSKNVAEDYLQGWAWVPIEKVMDYDLIDNMRPVMQAYLQLRRSTMT